MNRSVLAGVIAFSFFFSACSPASPPTDQAQPSEEQSSSVTMMDNEQSSTTTNNDKDETTVERKSDSEGVTENDESRVIQINAKNWNFSPAGITVKKGENISLAITSTEGAHGFAIPALGINTKLQQGETVRVPLPTDTAGTYEFFCSVPCGPGHQDMRGTLVIE